MKSGDLQGILFAQCMCVYVCIQSMWLHIYEINFLKNLECKSTYLQLIEEKSQIFYIASSKHTSGLVLSTFSTKQIQQ